MVKEASLHCYISNVFLPLGLDDADDCGPAAGRWDAEQTVFTRGGALRQNPGNARRGYGCDDQFVG